MLKYIMTKDNEPILFPPTINHSDMARYIRGKIVSAGFVSFRAIDDGDSLNSVEAHAHGYSLTLNMESRKEDSEIINRFLRIP